MKKTYILFFFYCFAWQNQAISQGLKQIEPDSAKPTAPNWELEYMDRANFLLNTTPLWDCTKTNRGDTDNGKRYWPTLTAEIYKAKKAGDTARVMSLIKNEGASGMNNQNEGTFNKPFSTPGYILYYFSNKDLLPAAQKERARNMWTNIGRQQTTRIDGNMDPIYKCTEFNSENFNWMGRIGGYMLAHEFDDNEPLNVNDIQNIPPKEYFDNWMKNWIRGTFNAGRVEWGSHVYTGFCLQAAAMLNQYSPIKSDREKGKAIADWLMIETALGYLDGAYVGPESRDKGYGFIPLAGSVWAYNYLYFATPTSPKIDTQLYVRNYTTGYVDGEGTGRWTAGFPTQILYRPAQPIIDLGLRNYKTPVELHSAKPHWHLDEDNYADWKADTERSRRNEFETRYLERNYTLASMAGYRPSGEGPFAECFVWRLGVKQPEGPAVQVFGNSGIYKAPNGRNPNEEVGQYRSALMRLVKNTDNMWVAFPKDIKVDIVGDTLLFVDMGSGVFVAVKTFNSNGAPVVGDIFERTNSGANNVLSHKSYNWKFAETDLGAMVMEVGTAEEYQTYDKFKTAILNKSTIKQLDDKTLVYKGANGHELKMEYVQPATYTYMATDCNKKTIDPAGVPGKVWGDGNYIDYSKWNIFEVVYGDPIVHSEWGKGQITVNAGGKGLRITIDQATAEVKYEVSDSPIGVPTSIGSANRTAQSGVRFSAIAPNPLNGEAHATFTLESPQDVKVVVYDLVGKKLATLREVKALAHTPYEVAVSASNLSNGTYIVRLEGERFAVSQKFVVLK